MLLVKKDVYSGNKLISELFSFRNRKYNMIIFLIISILCCESALYTPHFINDMKKTKGQNPYICPLI